VLGNDDTPDPHACTARDLAPVLVIDERIPARFATTAIVPTAATAQIASTAAAVLPLLLLRVSL
jgi:hypothetical protein